MGKVRIGVVGCGGIANQKHFPAMKNNADICEIVAFCDIIEERAKKACEQYGAEGAKYYTDYRELGAKSNVNSFIGTVSDELSSNRFITIKLDEDFEKSDFIQDRVIMYEMDENRFKQLSDAYSEYFAESPLFTGLLEGRDEEKPLFDLSIL